MKNTILRCAFLAAVACGLSSQAAASELKLSMQDGRVTIVAANVPLRQILAEWARIGQAKIVNADKLSSPAITLQLIDVPEKEALDILLRSASGYIAAQRPVAVMGAAMYDRVTIMATSRPPAATASNVAPPPTFQRPPMPVDVDDEPINVAMPQPGMGNNPVVGQFPGMPPQGVPGAPNVPQTQSQPGPMTSPRPGVLPPPQLPPGVPNPYQPPVRVPVGGRGGGGGI